MTPLVLVDGTGYLFRAYHAMPGFTTSRGAPTGAIFGTLNMLYKLLDEYQPERIAFVFDAPGKTFRDDIYPDYKANRPPMPAELGAQIEPLLEAVEAIGLAVVRVAGVEADDVIGTFADQASRAGLGDGHLHLRQGHGATGRRADGAGQHHDRDQNGPAGRA